MKSIVILIVFLFGITNENDAQDTLTRLNETWKGLTSQMQRRNEVAIVLLTELIQKKSLDSALLYKAKNNASDFTYYLTNYKSLDSSSVREVYQRNFKFKVSMGRALMQLENYPDIRQSDGIMNLMAHLEGTENRLTSAENTHNQLAESFKRKDLLFVK